MWPPLLSLFVETLWTIQIEECIFPMIGLSNNIVRLHSSVRHIRPLEYCSLVVWRSHASFSLLRWTMTACVLRRFLFWIIVNCYSPTSKTTVRKLHTGLSKNTAISRLAPLFLEYRGSRSAKILFSPYYWSAVHKVILSLLIDRYQKVRYELSVGTTTKCAALTLVPIIKGKYHPKREFSLLVIHD